MHRSSAKGRILDAQKRREAMQKPAPDAHEQGTNQATTHDVVPPAQAKQGAASQLVNQLQELKLNEGFNSILPDPTPVFLKPSDVQPRPGGFQHAAIHSMLLSKPLSGEALHEELAKKFLPLVNAINDNLWLVSSRGDIEKDRVLTDTTGRLMAAQALERYYCGVYETTFNMDSDKVRSGLAEVTEWSKTDAVSEKYFELVVDALNRQATMNGIAAHNKEEPTQKPTAHPPSKATDVARDVATASQPVPPDEPVITPEIMLEIHAVKPLPVDGDVAFAAQKQREDAFLNLYATIHRSNETLTKVHGEQGYTSKHLIDLAQQIESSALNIAASSHSTNDIASAKLALYKEEVKARKEALRRPKTLQQTMEDMIAVRVQEYMAHHAVQHEAAEKKLQNDIDEMIKKDEAKREAAIAKDKARRAENVRKHKEKLAARRAAEQTNKVAKDELLQE